VEPYFDLKKNNNMHNNKAEAKSFKLYDLSDKKYDKFV
jgi:hypothetical protein